MQMNLLNPPMSIYYDVNMVNMTSTRYMWVCNANLGGSSTLSVGPGPKIVGSSILSMQSALSSFKKAVFSNHEHFRFVLSRLRIFISFYMI